MGYKTNINILDVTKFVGVVSLSALILVSCGKKESASASSDSIVVKIGNVAPVTGPNAHLGKDNENGARLAIEEVNKQGLVINGKKVILEF